MIDEKTETLYQLYGRPAIDFYDGECGDRSINDALLASELLIESDKLEIEWVGVLILVPILCCFNFMLMFVLAML